jgi:hypothetical protein
MDDAYDALRGLIGRAVTLLDSQLQRIETGKLLLDEVCTAQADAEWQRCFGKESVVSILAKLVAMSRQLEDLRIPEKSQSEVVNEDVPLSDSEWQALEICVANWRAATPRS